MPSAGPGFTPKTLTFLRALKRNNRRDIDYSQLLEQKTYELHGIKTLISENHHSREQFWQIFNRPAYEAAKQRMDAAGLQPDLYDKFHR